jgi:cobalamin-dependent methionine synthase I
MLIIGERTNSSRKQIARAIAVGDRAFIQAEAKAQTLAGAHYIDVNAGTCVGEEAEKLRLGSRLACRRAEK